MRIKGFILFTLVLAVVSCRKDPKRTFEEHSFDFSSEWRYRTYNEYTGSVPYTILDTTHYWFEEDTMMERYTRTDFDVVESTANAHLYYALRYSSHSYFNPQAGSTPTIKEGVKGYIREDAANKKYYITYLDTTLSNGWEYLAADEEALLWDFGLPVNDSLDWCRWYIVQEGSNWLAGDEEEVFYGNYKFEKLNLYNSSNPTYLNTSMIRGIGSLNGIDGLSPNRELFHYHCSDFDYYP